MAASGLCCASLEEPKVLMKMGLSVLLLGHVNFMLAALVHGVVLRHINLHKQARAMEYAISNVVALTSGLVGVVVGILAIILSKNRRSRVLAWSLFVVSLVASLMAAAAAIGLSLSLVMAIIHGGRSLLTHCRFPEAIGYSSVTNECPFDPTRIYSTTVILWVPLIVTCVVQLVFAARCCAACASFLGLSCCTQRKRPADDRRSINVVRPEVETLPYREPQTHRSPAPPPTRHADPLRRVTAPPRQQQRRPLPPPYQPPPQHHHHHHHSLPPSERQPLRPHTATGRAERGRTLGPGAANGPLSSTSSFRGGPREVQLWV
ncbi:transmembrane protein 54-like [Gouania willdenowi]|uniref:Transmembrane protein 54-like n=1 Tax=Gouania willdenowi TaxID=441366 RepID=A0A8C5EUB7_GOUWI|nr:transmembrane protein 54-like [Gouania willdenowi]